MAWTRIPSLFFKGLVWYRRFRVGVDGWSPLELGSDYPRSLTGDFGESIGWREKFEELLRSFEQGSRIQNAAPYNSVAVVHKWETLNVPDPFAEVQEKLHESKRVFQRTLAKAQTSEGEFLVRAFLELYCVTFSLAENDVQVVVHVYFQSLIFVLL